MNTKPAITHDPVCDGIFRAYAADVAAFDLAHPHYCRTCEGWGWTSSPGCSVPYGMGSVNLPDESDPCPGCIEKGRCPWCGKDMEGEDTEAHCSECGYKDDGDSSGRPPEPICSCHFWEEVA